MVTTIEQFPEKLDVQYRVFGREEPIIKNFEFRQKRDDVLVTETLNFDKALTNVKEKQIYASVLRFLKSNQYLVNEFESMTSGDTTLMTKKPIIPNNELKELRLKLLREETHELQESIEDEIGRDALAGMLDALCDIQYVLSGAILHFGFASVFEEAFLEVHRSNMTKFLSSEEEAKKEITLFADKNIEAYYKEVGGKFVIFRMADNKVLKPSTYSPANIYQFIPK